MPDVVGILGHLDCSAAMVWFRAMKYVNRAQDCQPTVKRWVDGALNFCLPCRCVVCGLQNRAGNLCAPCRQQLPMCEAACMVCGLALDDLKVTICGGCQGRQPACEAVLAACWYEFPVRQLVARFKFQADLVAGRVLSDLLLERIGRQSAPAPDALIPVPLHSRRLSRRGFNQAYEIGRRIHSVLGHKLIGTGLRRVRATRPQTGLKAAQRRVNLAGAFKWRGPAVRGAHLVLVDDVMTTGQTLQSCSAVLREAGAARVEAWVLARAGNGA